MPRNLLMGDVVLRCQRRADQEFVNVIQPPEWKALISEMYAQLYSTAVQSGMRYFESTATITANGATSYAVPTDHDETIGIDRVADATSGRIDQLGELMIQERTRFSGLTGDASGYALIGLAIVLYPRPTTGTYLHVYVPQAPDISALADTATVDLVTGDGEAFLIEGVAAKAKPKTDADPSANILARNEAMTRFEADVKRRAVTNPRRRVVVRNRLSYLDDWEDGGWLGNDPGSWRNR